MNAYLINTETLEWPIYEGDYRLLNPNISFGNPLIPLKPFEWVKDTPFPQYDWVTQEVVEVTPVKIDESWFRVYEVIALSQEQVIKNQEIQKQNNKSQAESLLQKTDWTATVDISNPQYSNPYLANQDAFLAYRSQLRAIAINPPVNVGEWPVKPDEIWG